MTYVMERAWPFAIDAVPLQFGSASVTKVTAQFYYSKHRIVYHDPVSQSNMSKEIERLRKLKEDAELDYDDENKIFGRGQ